MPMQLTLDFTIKPQSQSRPIIQNDGWLDVSEIARGVGFITAVQISVNLNDELEPLQNEIDGDYDQRLYDCLWLAHFYLALDQIQSATFNFTLHRQHGNASEISETILRIRVEVKRQTTFVGLLQDY